MKMGRFDWFLSNRQWWRKWRGGHWERWIIDSPFNADIWMQREHGGERPPLGRGTPTCEEW